MGQSLKSEVKCAETSSQQKKDVPEPPQSASQDQNKNQQKEELIFDHSDVLKEEEKKNPSRPPAWDILMNQVKMVNYLEPLEGLKVELGLALSPHLQLANVISLHPGHPGLYSFNAIFAGGSDLNLNKQPNPLMMGRYEPLTGRQDIRLMYKHSDNVEFKLNANYMSKQLSQSQLTLETDFAGSDFFSNIKVSPSLDFFTCSFMQSMTNNLTLGLEFIQTFNPKLNTSLNVGGRYKLEEVQVFLQYLGGYNQLNLGATVAGNKYITFATEVGMNPMTQDSECTVGCAVRFPRAKYHALINSQGKLTSYLIHAINPFIKFSLCAEMDYFKNDHKFGIGFNMGT